MNDTDAKRLSHSVYTLHLQVFPHMPARDLYHDVVKQALQKDGWNITHDPLRISFGGRNLYADLGAERLISAEKGNSKIAVEIKGFAGMSDIQELEDALGQYILYRRLLAQTEPDRVLFLAVPSYADAAIFSEQIGRLVLEAEQLKLIVFDELKAEIIRWRT
jgi:hypothetical protein